MPVDVRQAPLDAVVVERQPLVVDAQQVQDGGVEVVGRHRVDDRGIADGVGGPVGEALLEPRAGQDVGEALRVVVAAAAELARSAWANGVRPNSVVIMTTVESSRPRILEVADQPGDRPVDAAGLAGVALVAAAGDVVVGVPGDAVARPELDHPDAPLDQPPGDQAVAGRVAALVAVEPVELLDVAGLGGEVRRLGDGRLHPRRQLVAPDARGQGIGLGLLLQVDRVELLEQFQARSRCVSAEAPPAGWRSRTGGPPRVLKATPWCSAGRNPLVQLKAPPAAFGMPRASGRTTKPGRLSFSVPRPYESQEPIAGKPIWRNPVFAWKMPGMWLAVSATIELITVSSSATSARLGNRSETQSPLLPAAPEGVVRPVEPPHLAEERVGLAEALGHVLAVVLLQLGLVVERVDLAQAAAEEDVDDVPGLRLEVRAADGAAQSAVAASRWPPRSSRSAAAIAGRPKTASRRKSRRVV